MLGKLIEKDIGERLQFQLILKDFIHLYQLDSLKQHSTTDVEVVLTYFIHTGWVKNLLTNTLVFNIVQFFPSLNYQLLPLILDKVEFNSKISSFFHDYLVSRKTNISKTIFYVLLSMLTLVLDEVPYFLPYYLLHISFLFFIFSKKGQKI